MILCRSSTSAAISMSADLPGGGHLTSTDGQPTWPRRPGLGGIVASGQSRSGCKLGMLGRGGLSLRGPSGNRLQRSPKLSQRR